MHKRRINLTFPGTALTFGFKAKIFGNLRGLNGAVWKSFGGNCARALRLTAVCLVPRVFIPLDQRSGNERPWKVLIGSPKISDFRLHCTCLAFKRMTQRTSWCFTSGHFYCIQNQLKAILQRNFRESLVSSSLCSKKRRLEVRD